MIYTGMIINGIIVIVQSVYLVVALKHIIEKYIYYIKPQLK